MRIVKSYSLLACIILAMGLFITSCQKSENNGTSTPSIKSVPDYDHTVATSWNELFLVIERYAAGYRPGPAPRALAYMGLSAYEASVSGMKEHKSVANYYAGLSLPAVETGKEYHWPTVVNASYAYLMRRFFATSADDLFQKIGALENQNNGNYQTEISADVFDRSRQYGQDVATAIWNWSKTDAVGHDAYLDPFKDYDWQAHYTKPGDWVPTVPGPGKPMFGYWGKARTFAISEADKLCPAPIPYSEATNSPFFNQAMEVYANTVNAPYENIWIGEFWSDDLVNLTFSPGPRWQAIADQVFNNEHSNLETALYCNAKMGMALNDAAVACWHSKYTYNVERPESYIKRLIDQNWEPLLFNPLTNQAGVTPSFPAYPSGHSTMGAAAAEVLTDIFGINYAMTDRCHENRPEFEGKPRSFNTFYEMAVENAWSRVPLGVHFRMDSEQGVQLGYRCGRKVNNLDWKK
ncbi:MAG: vanadium-dependent haloperoxidase [Bacteroidota bacterium]